MSPRHNDIGRKELDKMVDAGVITPTISLWGFPSVIGTKKYCKQSLYMDFHSLNQNTKPYLWPVPKFQEIFDDLEGSLVSSTLGLFSGY